MSEDEATIFGSPSDEIKTTASPEARFYIEDMRELAQAVKEGDTFTAYMFRADQWYIGIARPNDEHTLAWVGIAAIPLTMTDLAARWFADIEDDIDVENLMREWGGEELTDEFGQFVEASNG